MSQTPHPKRKDLLLDVLVFCAVRPLERPRKAFNSRHFYQPKENQAELLSELIPYQKLVDKPFEEPVIVDITCFFKKPHSEEPYPVAPTYGDEDNLRKAVNDALVDRGILSNDRFVIGGLTFKLFAIEPHAHIQIWRPE